MRSWSNNNDFWGIAARIRRFYLKVNSSVRKIYMDQPGPCSCEKWDWAQSVERWSRGPVQFPAGDPKVLPLKLKNKDTVSVCLTHLNLQGVIFSRSLNDNRRMIITGLYFIRCFSQNVCFNKVYSKRKHKPEPNPNREFWTAGNRYFGVLPIRIVKSNENMFLSDEEPTLETLDFTIRIGSTPTFFYFDL